jgi:hypothetical protein
LFIHGKHDHYIEGKIDLKKNEKLTAYFYFMKNNDLSFMTIDHFYSFIGTISFLFTNTPINEIINLHIFTIKYQFVHVIFFLVLFVHVNLSS